jgi:hypothetical protein
LRIDANINVASRSVSDVIGFEHTISIGRRVRPRRPGDYAAVGHCSSKGNFRDRYRTYLNAWPSYVTNLNNFLSLSASFRPQEIAGTSDHKLLAE